MRGVVRPVGSTTSALRSARAIARYNCRQIHQVFDPFDAGPFGGLFDWFTSYEVITAQPDSEPNRQANLRAFGKERIN